MIIIGLGIGFFFIQLARNLLQAHFLRSWSKSHLNPPWIITWSIPPSASIEITRRTSTYDAICSLKKYHTFKIANKHCYCPFVIIATIFITIMIIPWWYPMKEYLEFNKATNLSSFSFPFFSRLFNLYPREGVKLSFIDLTFETKRRVTNVTRKFVLYFLSSIYTYYVSRESRFLVENRSQWK